LASDAIAGTTVGIGQAAALGLRHEGTGDLDRGTASGTGLAFAIAAAVMGPGKTTTGAVSFVVVSGVVIGSIQYVVFIRARIEIGAMTTSRR